LEYASFLRIRTYPVAQRIADLTGAEAWDGFKNQVPEDEMLCAVIDCGGTARIGVCLMLSGFTPDTKISSVICLAKGPDGDDGKISTVGMRFIG
jgi:sorbitol-specific phosphotransferase system component IIBC